MTELFEIGFLSITWADVVDVVLISVLFFVLYRTLRDTLALQVLFILGVLLLLSFITDALGMKTSNWILRRIGDVGLIAFVVLFQPELRRIVLMLTQTPIFRMFMRSNTSEVIQPVVEAVMELTTKHVGALIVFSKADHVKVTVDTGVELNADVSSELLLSIFNTRSPLHDGAVVLDGQRVVAARCVLPLSGTQKLGGRTLGTRHRAGLGLSEQADALVLIVSEERGTASLAYSGEIELDIPLNILAETLQRRLAMVAQA
jgi:diadenylate cyclase